MRTPRFMPRCTRWAMALVLVSHRLDRLNIAQLNSGFEARPNFEKRGKHT